MKLITCGVNLMILGRAAKGNGIYQDGESNTAASGRKRKGKGDSQNASLAFNIMASFIGTGMNKGGNSHKVDAVASPFVDSLDIAGYNYSSGRYPLEGQVSLTFWASRMRPAGMRRRYGRRRISQ